MSHVGAYTKSKTLSEQQVWRFVKEHESEIGWSATTICPSATIGPIMTKRISGTVELTKMLLQNEMSMAPMHLSFVDVRDVA
eukprot:CAMPEP_0197050712 /NCGR_PEP_ID=MMETSP1384-20130603/25554_1 /TAXON_ID=29189 /ORGANISM="Ammonia sp." /LENGTH=81 /DNA_ID=CAMNT_0042483159 /DNA_START=33 /DNA_END=275 /DNA_ORIENTATION=-